MARMKFALVGCGRIATLHTAGYRDHPDAELWGVFDTNAATAKGFGAEHGVPHVYDSFEAVLADDEITGVELLIPITCTASTPSKHCGQASTSACRSRWR